MGLFNLTYEDYKTVRQMRTSIRLLVPPKSIRSIIDVTWREQQHGLA